MALQESHHKGQLKNSQWIGKLRDHQQHVRPAGLHPGCKTWQFWHKVRAVSSQGVPAGAAQATNAGHVLVDPLARNSFDLPSSHGVRN